MQSKIMKINTSRAWSMQYSVSYQNSLEEGLSLDFVIINQIQSF